MGSKFIIAQKEFIDLLSNRMVLFVIIAFIIYSVSSVYNFYEIINGRIPHAHVMYDQNAGIAADNNVFFGLAWFGTIIGIIIGCSIISSERIGNALNTLVVKPVYRDTIINGKILGALIFLVSFAIFYIAISTSLLMVFCGNFIAPFLFDYISRMPFVLIVAIVFTLVFLSASVFISLLVRNQALTMMLSTLTVYLSLNCTTAVSYKLDNIFPGSGLGSFFVGLSPYSVMWEGGLQDRLMNTSMNAWDAFQSILPDFIRLLIIVIIMLAISYSIFIRSDIS